AAWRSTSFLYGTAPSNLAIRKNSLQLDPLPQPPSQIGLGTILRGQLPTHRQCCFPAMPRQLVLPYLARNASHPYGSLNPPRPSYCEANRTSRKRNAAAL